MTGHRQRGYLALAMIVLLSLVSAGTLMHGLIRSSGHLHARETKWSQIALREAHAALIAKAALEDNTPGALLCPDTSASTTSPTFGESNSCPDVLNGEALGCLPWKTLGIPSATRYGIAPLWYAMSADLRSASYTARDRTTASRQINPANEGQLSLVTMADGGTRQILAAIIAPGAALDGQSRRAPGCDAGQAFAYLDSAFSTAAGTVSNAARSGRIALADTSLTFNDRVLPITREDLMQQVIPVVLQAFGAVATTIKTKPPVSGQRLSEVRGETLVKQAIYDNALWSIWMPGTELFTAIEPDCAKGQLAGIDYACVGKRTDTRGITSYVYCFVPPGSVRTQITWLCFNRWYEFVRYEDDGNHAPRLSAALGDFRCVLTVDADMRFLTCKNGSDQDAL